MLCTVFVEQRITVKSARVFFFSKIFIFTDEGIAGSEPNTVSLRRDIAVLDENDNPPVYQGRPYATRVQESSQVGSLLLSPGTIVVTDNDGGVNADVQVYCSPASKDDDVCETFSIMTEQVKLRKIFNKIFK